MSIKKKNILIITSQFLPYTKSIGGIARVFGFTQELKKKYNVRILTQKNKYYGYLGLNKYVKDFDIDFISTKAHKQSAQINKFFKLIKNIIKTIFRNLFYILSIDSLFIYKSNYSISALKLIKKSKIDIVLVSSPPFSLLSISRNIKKKYPNVKIVLDYRDGWTQRISSKYLSLIKFFIFTFIEKEILKISDLVITATQTIKDDIDKKISTNSHLITNGYLSKFNSIPSNKSKKNKFINIGYFVLVSESIFSYRDLNILYNSLKNNNKVIIHFYGNSDIKKKKFINFKNFSFHKNIDFKEVNTEMKKMDYLLVYHSESSTVREVVTSKFYEYLTTNVPILVITNGESEASYLVNKYKLGISINYQVDNLIKFFKSDINKKYKISNNKNKLLKFSRNFQSTKFVKLIDKHC